MALLAYVRTCTVTAQRLLYTRHDTHVQLCKYDEIVAFVIIEEGVVSPSYLIDEDLTSGSPRLCCHHIATFYSSASQQRSRVLATPPPLRRSIVNFEIELIAACYMVSTMIDI